jgi:serine/threonine protein kinase
MVCGALEYLHERTILHNDLKDDNIVVERRGGQLSPVIIDFGKACLFQNAKILHIDKSQQEEYIRKYKHIDPEVVKGQRKQSESSDVFSFGVVIGDCSHLHNIAKMCKTRSEIRPSLSFVRHELKGST